MCESCEILSGCAKCRLNVQKQIICDLCQEGMYLEADTLICKACSEAVSGCSLCYADILT